MKRLETEKDVSTLLYASTMSAALGAAVETGLLWMLAETPMDAETVARDLKIPLKRCSYWLQILQALGILETAPQGYAPSALARSAILETRSQKSWGYLVKDERERTAGIHNLALFIDEPGSVWQAQGLNEPKNYVERLRRDPEQARVFTRMLYEVHQYLGEELAAVLDLADAHRLMDLGGNSGVVSMALLRKYPALTATVVDLENVCLAGREIACQYAEENGFADRLTYHPAEFFSDDFPGGFDVILKCDVSVYSESLWHKVWASLNPGGRLIMVEHFSPTENTPPQKRLEWSFLDSLEDPEFSIPTIAQVREQLAQAGFRPLPGETVLSDQRTVIQALKDALPASRMVPPVEMVVPSTLSVPPAAPAAEETGSDLSKLNLNLPAALVDDILNYLQYYPKAPTLSQLNCLIRAYLRNVPWESVSRIVKRHNTTSTAACPRWPEEFWRAAIQDGFGGTCFESSLAFFSLLVSLGYEGYLTINDMGEVRRCHGAIVVLLEGSKYLVDITIPVHTSIRIDPQKSTRRSTPFHKYSLVPMRENVYELRRSHHPNGYAFTLIDFPVCLDEFRAVVLDDYSEQGRFLHSVVMVKTIDNKVWRFFSDLKPPRLESFNRAGKSETYIPSATLVSHLAAHFQLPQEKITTALSWV